MPEFCVQQAAGLAAPRSRPHSTSSFPPPAMQRPELLSADNSRALLEPKAELAADGGKESGVLRASIAARSNRAASPERSGSPDAARMGASRRSREEGMRRGSDWRDLLCFRRCWPCSRQGREVKTLGVIPQLAPYPIKDEGIRQGCRGWLVKGGPAAGGEQ